MNAQAWLQVSGYVVAFLTAMLVVIVDCNSTLRKAVQRVPLNVLKSPAIWVVAGVCGAVSAGCFSFSNTEFLKGIVDLKWQFPPGRGLLVGLAVLTIIRSKFFNFKDTEIGGEFFYNSGRAWALKLLWRQWRLFKDNYVTSARIQKALQIQDFEERTLTAVKEAVRLDPDEFKHWVDQQFANLAQTKPATPANSADTPWQSYYRKFIKLALDCCGTDCFSGFKEEGF